MFVRHQSSHSRKACLGGWPAPCRPREENPIWIILWQAFLPYSSLWQHSSKKEKVRGADVMLPPSRVCFNLWLHEILGVSPSSKLCSFTDPSHFIWLGPVSPSLACLLLLVNKSSRETSRLEDDFFYRKVPSAFIPLLIQARASRRNQWQAEEGSFSVTSAKMAIGTCNLGQCPPEQKSHNPTSVARLEDFRKTLNFIIPSPSASFKARVPIPEFLKVQESLSPRIWKGEASCSDWILSKGLGNKKTVFWDALLLTSSSRGSRSHSPRSFPLTD